MSCLNLRVRVLCSAWLSGSSDGEGEVDARVPSPPGSSTGAGSLLDTVVLAQWEDRAELGLFRYDVTACPTKVRTLCASLFRTCYIVKVCCCTGVSGRVKRSLTITPSSRDSGRDTEFNQFSAAHSILRIRQSALVAYAIQHRGVEGVETLRAGGARRVWVHCAVQRGPRLKEAPHGVLRGQGAVLHPYTPCKPA